MPHKDAEKRVPSDPELLNSQQVEEMLEIAWFFDPEFAVWLHRQLLPQPRGLGIRRRVTDSGPSGS